MVDSIALLMGKLREARVVEASVLDKLAARVADQPIRPETVGRELVKRGLLTAYQLEEVLADRGRDLSLGQYSVLERLGQGGTGEVFKARHRTLGRLAAVKVIRRELLATPGPVQRFYREVEATSRLHHPHIVEAYDAGPCGATHFLAMEYVNGTDLAHLVKERGPLAPALAASLIRQAALGLQHAHESGLVHRDVKPSNLIVDAVSGRLKILDLGLVRLGPTDADDRPATLTESGGFIGTPDFMAPEQAENSHAVDHRADVYSLGATLYFLLSGKVLFPDCTLFQKLIRLQTVDPTPLEQLRPGLPAELLGLVQRLMAKQPADRPQSMTEVLAELPAGAAVPMTVRPITPDDPTLSDPLPTPASLSRGPISAIDDSSSSYTLDRAAQQRLRRRISIWGAGAVLGFGVLFLLLALRGFHTSPGADSQLAVRPTTAASPSTTTTPEPPPLSPFARWIDRTAGLPADAQLKEVAAKLKEMNTGFDGVVTPTLTEKDVTALDLRTDAVADLRPLQALRKLQRLTCSGTGPGAGKLRDLAPLQGMRLKVLNCNFNQIKDLSPVQEMRELEALHCAHNPLGEDGLAPLRNTNLTILSCQSTGVKQLAPLRELRRLSELICADDPVVDLGPIAALPSLAVLNIAGTAVTQLTPLQGCAALRRLDCGRNKSLVDLRPLAALRGLQHLNCGGTSVADLRPLQGLALVGLNCRDTPTTDLTPVCRVELKSLDCANLALDQKAFVGLRLSSLTCSGTRLTDLDFTTSMPLESLDCSRTAVANLRPLAGKGITSLNCADCPKIEDLTPLADGPLTSLNCGNTRVESFYPLRRLKSLTSLSCAGCPAADWESLKDVPLKELTIDARRPDLDALKRLRSLERINGQLRSDFFRTTVKLLPSP